MTTEAIELAYGKFMISSLEVCFSCNKVSECVPNGDRVTGWDPQAMKSIRVPIWFCWECLGDLSEPVADTAEENARRIAEHLKYHLPWEGDEN